MDGHRTIMSWHMCLDCLSVESGLIVSDVLVEIMNHYSFSFLW